MYSKMERGNITTVEEWIFKVIDLVEMAKFTALLRDINLTKFLAGWPPLLDFLQYKGKKNNFCLWDLTVRLI